MFVLATPRFLCSFFCVSGACVKFVSLFSVVSSSAVSCLERLVTEVTCYVLSGMHNPTNSTELTLTVCHSVIAIIVLGVR